MDRAGGKAAGDGGERIAYVDAARGLAILCVVLGHLYPGDGIVQYISSFHVPVFFILSGLLMGFLGEVLDYRWCVTLGGAAALLACRFLIGGRRQDVRKVYEAG